MYECDVMIGNWFFTQYLEKIWCIRVVGLIYRDGWLWRGSWSRNPGLFNFNFYLIGNITDAIFTLFEVSRNRIISLIIFKNDMRLMFYFSFMLSLDWTHWLFWLLTFLNANYQKVIQPELFTSHSSLWNLLWRFSWIFWNFGVRGGGPMGKSHFQGYGLANHKLN